MRVVVLIKATRRACVSRLSGSERKVLDGPSAETKALLAGYWLRQVRSMDEALEWVRLSSDLPGSRSPLRDAPIRFGGTLQPARPPSAAPARAGENTHGSPRSPTLAPRRA